MKKPRENWTSVNGLTMFYRSLTECEGKHAVVLVHGLSVSGRYMMPTAQSLAPYYPIYVPDLPGFGRSDKPAHILNIAELTDALAEWMRLTGIEHASLLGNSLGCQFIVDLAKRYPKLVDAAVFVGPTMDPQAHSVWKQIGRGAKDMLREPIRYWPLLTWDYAVAGAYRTIKTLQFAVKDPLVEKLPEVKIPVLVVRGEKDPIAPQRWADEMVRRLPNARLHVIPAAAHVPNYSAAESLALAVREFLESIS